MQFCEYSGWILAANGDENLKFKDSGTVLRWNTCYTSPAEEQHLIAGMKACILLPYWATGDYFSTQPWESQQIAGQTITFSGTAFLTSSCAIALTIVDCYTACLLHFDGVDASTTITESAPNLNTFVCVGNAQLDTASFRFGTASLMCDGTGDSVTCTFVPSALVTASALFSPGTGNDFVLEFFFCVDPVATEGNWKGLFDFSTDATNFFYARYNIISGKFLIEVYGKQAGLGCDIETDSVYSPGVWYHFCLSRHENYMRLFIDGTMVEEATSGGPCFAMGTVYSSIGRCNLVQYHHGWIDEFRIMKSYTRDADFTPPSVAYTVSNYTLTSPDVNVPVQIGIAPPTTAPTVADSGAGGLPNGVYYYKVSFINNERFESNLGPVSASVTVASHSVRITQLPISLDPQVVGRRIYRTKAGGTTQYFVKEILNNTSVDVDETLPVTANIIDNVADSALVLEEATDHDEPPIFSELESHYSLLYGVETASPNKIWECKEFDSWEYFPPQNYYSFGSKSDSTDVLISMGEYLCGLQQDKIWTLNTTVSPLEKQKSLSEYGVTSKKAAVCKGDAIILANVAGVFHFAKQNILESARTVALSTAVRTLFDRFSTNPNRIDQSQGSKIAVTYARDHILVSYSSNGKTENDKTLDINLEQKVIEGIWEKGFASFTVDTRTKIIYGLEVSSQKVCQLFTTTKDDNVNIAWYARTKEFGKEFGNLTAKKRGNFVKLDCNANGGTLTVLTFVNGVQISSKTFGDVGRKLIRWRLDIDYDWYFISFTIIGTRDQTVYSIGVEAEQLAF